MPLPFNIEVRVSGAAGSISSDLRKEVGFARAEAMEALLLAMAGAGIAIDTPPMREAVLTAAESIANHI